MSHELTASGPDTVLRVLADLETLPSEATGALAYGPEQQLAGVVLLERGRVCWAAAPGLRRRLTDLLRQSCSPPIGADEVERLFVECRSLGRPVGEVLVEKGHVSPEALRSALLHHTAESLALADSWSNSPRWVPHRARGYQSAYTFLPVELLSYASSALRGQALVTSAHARLNSMAGCRSAAVFDAPGRTLLACRLPEERRTGLRALRSAGAWAAESFAESAERSPVLKFTFDGRGGMWLGWRDEGLTYLVHCRDREDFSAQVRTLNEHGWTSAVQSNVRLVDSQIRTA